MLRCREDVDLARVRSQLKALQRKARKQRHDEDLRGLTQRAQHVCVAVYILSDYNMDMAASFARQVRQSRKKTLPNCPDAEWPGQIGVWFRGLPMERLYDLQSGGSNQDVSIRAEARNFIAKWRTASWVTDQNYQCGHAPTYGAVAERFHSDAAAALLSSAHGRDGKRGVAGRHARS